MIILTGNSLSERQQELNLKVKEAAASNTSLEDVISKTDETDIDAFFKIDLASKYENVEYMIEKLKSGDSLHITRALKSIWLYDDKYSNIINPDYLNDNVFPMMSLKLKRKLLTVVSTHVRNEDRAHAFYKYCIEQKLTKIAYKFLIHSPESIKLQNQGKVDGDLIHFIGNSFKLANAYLNWVNKHEINFVLYDIRYLYSVSDVQYLNLIEKFGQNKSPYSKRKTILGLRTSRHIMKNHKKRVLEMPRLYIEMLNKNMIVKYSNSNDAKLYLISLLPEKCTLFWDHNFCKTYNFLIDLIPTDEKFIFMKKIFSDSYPEQEFEMSFDFYKFKCYNLMTIEEREMWALKHIECQKEILGEGKDYIWYKFVNFNSAFKEIKKYVMITPGKDKRGEIINILIKSAKTQRDLEILFNHYYQRHVNEAMHNKEGFLKLVMERHNVFDFDDDCWTAFDKLLCSIDLYTDSTAIYNAEEITVMSLLYHIIHKKDIPGELSKILNTGSYFYALKTNLRNLDDGRKEMIYKHIRDYYINIFEQYEKETYNKEVQNKARNYIMLVMKLLGQFDKTKMGCPEIIEKYVNLDWDYFRNTVFFNDRTKKVTQEHFVRQLKKDSTLVINELPLVQERIESDFRFNLNKFLRKLKIYFPNDVARNYLDFFSHLLSKPEPYKSFTKISSSVYSIFQLADNGFINDFMMKHVPLEAKIDYKNADRQLRYTQEYICRFACYSRPPVPLSNMLMYIKGDYVRFCLPMFNMYLANLPLPQCLEFIEEILDTPISIQKHGIRMAFGCFNADNLNKLILRAWKKTKNISLRSIIYKALYKKINEEKDTARRQLFETLKVFTIDLHQDYDDEIFTLLTSDGLPPSLVCEFLETGWLVVSKFPNKAMNLNRMTRIINAMDREINGMQKSVIKSIIDDHVKCMLIEEQIQSKYDMNELRELNKAKWKLVANFIMNVKNEVELEENIALLKTITNKCYERWNAVHQQMYTMRNFYIMFVSYLESQSLCHDIMGGNNYSNTIFKVILKDLEDSLPIHVSYLLIWDIRLNIITRDVSVNGKKRLAEVNSAEDKILAIKECVLDFSREVGKLIKEFVNRNLYFGSLLSSIKREVEEKVGRLYNFIFDFRQDNLDLNDIYTITATGLLEFEMTETYLLALNFLPLNYNRGFYKDYTSAIEKLNACENPEIHCNMYERFVNSDFVYRDYILWRDT